MSQFGWSDCPRPVRLQIETLVDTCVQLLDANLGGVYLHGSLAMNCFNPSRSDIDLLVVTHHGIDLATKRRLAERLLSSSNKPRPIEISFLRLADLVPWRHPTPFDFHYSEDWRERMTRDLATEGWQCWNDAVRNDADLAAHVTVTLARGIALVGPPPPDVFPCVPAVDYLDSIWRDVEDAGDRIDTDTVYVTLNLCRVCAFVRTGRVCSKDEGGAWAREVVAPRFRSLVGQALEAYRGGRADDTIDRRETAAFARVMLDEIAGHRTAL